MIFDYNQINNIKDLDFHVARLEGCLRAIDFYKEKIKQLNSLVNGEELLLAEIKSAILMCQKENNKNKLKLIK